MYGPKYWITIFLVLVSGVESLGQGDQRGGLQAYRAERLKELDRSSRLSKADHEQLWKHGVVLKVAGVSDAFVIDAFGLAGTAYVDHKKSTMCVDLMKSVSEEVVGRELDFGDLKVLLLKLKARVDAQWKELKTKTTPRVIFRAELSRQYSKARKKQEAWLLVDVYQDDSKSQDAMDADYARLVSKRSTAPYLSDAPETVIQYRPPHPKYLETDHFWKNLPPPKPNRNQVMVTVQDDGLTAEEREAELGFRFTDKTGRKSHQLEGLGGPPVGEFPNAKTQACLREAWGLFGERLPRGVVVTTDELHLRVGSVVSVLNRRYSDVELHVTVKHEETIGDRTYSSLWLEARPR